MLTEETQNFALLGVSVYCIFGKDELPVHNYIKDASSAGD